jgi:hypothetical protein
LPAQDLVPEVFQLVGAIADPIVQPAPVVQQFDQRIELRLARRGVPDGQHGGRVGQDHGVGTIVLGQPSIGLRKHPDAVGVVADDLEAPGLQRVHDLGLVAARGFQADAADALFAQPGGQSVETAGLAAFDVRHGCVSWPKCDIKPTLADIDPRGGYKLCHLSLPYLQYGLGDLATVRVVKIGQGSLAP